MEFCVVHTPMKMGVFFVPVVLFIIPIFTMVHYYVGSLFRQNHPQEMVTESIC